MRVLLQRVSTASVTADGKVVGEIGRGYLALVGVTHDDTEGAAHRLAKKVAGIRLFPNPSEPDRKPIDTALAGVAGAVLAVSQFTLYADTSRGRRPSFVRAAGPEHARTIFDAFVVALREEGLAVETGIFGAHMEVALVNDGPVTIMLDDGT